MVAYGLNDAASSATDGRQTVSGAVADDLLSEGLDALDIGGRRHEPGRVLPSNGTPPRRQEKEVARMIRVAAADAILEGDARRSLGEQKAFLALKATELETFNMLSRDENIQTVVRAPGVDASPSRSPRSHERNQKLQELQRRNRKMLEAVENAVKVDVAIAAEKHRQEAEAQLKAATEAKQKAEAEAEKKAAEEARVRAEKEAAIRRAEEETAKKLAIEAQRKAAEEEVKQKAATEAAAKDAEEKAKAAQAAAPAAGASTTSTRPNSISISSQSASSAANSGEIQRDVLATPAALEQAGKFLERLRTIKETVRPAIKADSRLNNQCFKAKMGVTVKVGQITNSRQQVRRISNELCLLLDEMGRTSPVAREWLMDVLAKQIANQAEKEVSVNRPLAFPMARIVQNVTAKNPDFLAIFMGRLVKRNPYLVPKYLLRQKGEESDAYYKRLGMKKADDGWEKEAQYEERICGTTALFSAFIQTLPEGIAATHVTLADGWTWLARLLNMQPRKITPQLILTFIETAGPEFVRAYRKQALKLLRFISDKFLLRMPKESVAATTRLRLFLDSHRNKLHPTDAEGFRYGED